MDDAMDVDAAQSETPTPTPKPTPSRRGRRPRLALHKLKPPRAESDPAQVPFPSAGPPSPQKSPSKQRAATGDNYFRRPSSPRKNKSSWFDSDADSTLTGTTRSASPTKSGSWASSRSSSSRSSGRPVSPTSLPWAEGRIPPSPTKPAVPSDSTVKVRQRPPSLRLHDNPDGIDPAQLIGKTLRRVTRGSTHPNLTLYFADNSIVQVKMEGYNPNMHSLSKELEMDSSLDDVLNSAGNRPVDLVILDCALVRLTDKAFELHDTDESSDARWDQDHLGIAFKFDGMPHRWYSVWATMADYDEEGLCKFRSYDDIFLSPVAQTPRRPRHTRKKSAQLV